MLAGKEKQRIFLPASNTTMRRSIMSKSERDPSSIRSALKYLDSKGDVEHVRTEVDPILEIAGIQKALDKGPVLCFENIKGYPNFRDIGNFFSRRDRLADLFGVDDPKNLKMKFVEAIKNPVPTSVISEAPCQETIITDNIDVLSYLPVLKHTDRDGGRIIGGGIQLLAGPWFDEGTHVSFNRIHFRGKNWATIGTGQISHLGEAAFRTFRNERIPLTININPPPAVQMVAGTWNVRTIVHKGMSELGIAGGFQGSPVELAKAVSVPTYSIAQAEIVIEGYLEPETAWETEASEKSKEFEKDPYFPEWVGYLGRSWKFRKFTATALTHRKDRPIFYTPLAHGLEYAGFDILREAGFYEMAERLYPGFVADVYVPEGLKWGSGVVFQVKKYKPQDEGLQRNLLLAAMANAPGMRMVVAVDEDVDIYNADDLIWAIESRCNPITDIILPAGGMRGIQAQPMEIIERGVGGYEGGVAFDATKPFNKAWRFERPHYPSDQIDLNKWFSQDKLSAIKGQQTEYARTLARKGW